LRAELLHLTDELHGLGANLTEDDVFAVKVGEGIEAEEELGSVRSGAGVSHGEDTGASVLVDEVLVSEFFAVDGLATSAVSAGEVATLGHEASDNAVESASLEVEGLALLAHALLASAESAEVLGGLGGVTVEVDENAACRLTSDGDVEEDSGMRGDHLMIQL